MWEDEVTEEQIQQWADEAEVGYDVKQLKRRGRGRPGRGAEPMQVEKGVSHERARVMSPAPPHADNRHYDNNRGVVEGLRSEGISLGR